MLRWYLVHTKPCCETVAKSNLERQGYEVYLPLALQPVHRRGRWHEKVAPLFPRYLFLGLRTGQQTLNPVRSTVGVSSVVRIGSEYAIVHGQIVSNLRANEDCMSGLHCLSQALKFDAGATVLVAAGVFDEFEGVFQRHAGNERVDVLLDMLGQLASVRVPVEFVVPCRAG